MMRVTRRQAVVMAAAAPISLALSTPAQAATHRVEIKGFKYNPAELTVAAGDIVEFADINGTHTATALDGSFDTGRLRKGESAQITFSSKGAFPYKCTFHPNMKGSITVV